MLNKMLNLKEEKGRWMGLDALPRCPFSGEKGIPLQLGSAAGRDPQLCIPVGIVSAQEIHVI